MDNKPKEYCFTAEEFTIKINELKDGLLKQLAADSVISIQKAEILRKTYFFTLVKPQYITSLYKPEKEEKLSTILVKTQENLFH